MKKIKIISGSFLPGCGICATDGKDFFHILCFEDKETGETFTEFRGKRYYENDIIIK